MVLDRAARSRGMEIVVYVAGVTAFYCEIENSQATIVHPLTERLWGTLDFTVEDPNGVQLIFTEAPKWDC